MIKFYIFRLFSGLLVKAKITENVHFLLPLYVFQIKQNGFTSSMNCSPAQKFFHRCWNDSSSLPREFWIFRELHRWNLQELCVVRLVFCRCSIPDMEEVIFIGKKMTKSKINVKLITRDIFRPSNSMDHSQSVVLSHTWGELGFV